MRRRGSGYAPPLHTGNRLLRSPVSSSSRDPIPARAQEQTQQCFPSSSPPASRAPRAELEPEPEPSWRRVKGALSKVKARLAGRHLSCLQPSTSFAIALLQIAAAAGSPKGPGSEGGRLSEHAEPEPGSQGGRMRSLRTLECGESKALPTGRHATPPSPPPQPPTAGESSGPLCPGLHSVFRPAPPGLGVAYPSKNKKQNKKKTTI